jgi:hypothetical protein
MLLENLLRQGHRTRRCLVHIKRMCLMRLTKYPKHTAAQELRKIVLLLLKIKADNDKLYWIKLLHAWYQRRKMHLNEKTNNEQTGRYWYTYNLLRRSYYLIKKALPNMFHYLQNLLITNTTNRIEGIF